MISEYFRYSFIFGLFTNKLITVELTGCATELEKGD